MDSPSTSNATEVHCGDTQVLILSRVKFRLAHSPSDAQHLSERRRRRRVSPLVPPLSVSIGSKA